jgi:hypothetical protein
MTNRAAEHNVARSFERRQKSSFDLAGLSVRAAYRELDIGRKLAHVLLVDSRDFALRYVTIV